MLSILNPTDPVPSSNLKELKPLEREVQEPIIFPLSFEKTIAAVGANKIESLSNSIDTSNFEFREVP